MVASLAVVLIVLGSAGGNDDTSTKSAGTAEERTATTTPPARRGRRAPRDAYTVKGGDTLGSIAVKTGVGVERLQELNPQLDPQALIAGQKIKLRE